MKIVSKQPLRSLSLTHPPAFQKETALLAHQQAFEECLEQVFLSI